jgi:hypothetical protein
MTARQAAEDCASRVPNVEEYTDIIEAAIAEATKPLATANLRLVDALEEARLFCNTEGRYRIDDVLAKVGK